MPNIIHDPGGQYRVDVLIGDRIVGSSHFTATTDDEVSATARQIVIAHGGDLGDVYQHNGTGGATYYESVGVE